MSFVNQNLVKTMYSVIWKYTIVEKNRRAFEAAYGATGTWATFFRSDKSYRGSQLLNNTKKTTEYLLIDQWSNRLSYQTFIDRQQELYQKMSKDFEGLYEAEERVGEFHTVE